MYEIENLYIASAFAAIGERLLTTTKNDDGRVIFVFADPEGKLAALTQDYYHGRFPAIQIADYVDQLILTRDKLSATKQARYFASIALTSLPWREFIDATILVSSIMAF